MTDLPTDARALRADTTLLAAYLRHAGWTDGPAAGTNPVLTHPPTGTTIRPRHDIAPATAVALKHAAAAMSMSTESLLTAVEKAGYDRFTFAPAQYLPEPPPSLEAILSLLQNISRLLAHHAATRQQGAAANQPPPLARTAAAAQPVPGEHNAFEILYHAPNPAPSDLPDSLRESLERWSADDGSRPAPLSALASSLSGGLLVITAPSHRREPYPGQRTLHFQSGAQLP